MSETQGGAGGAVSCWWLRDDDDDDELFVELSSSLSLFIPCEAFNFSRYCKSGIVSGILKFDSSPSDGVVESTVDKFGRGDIGDIEPLLLSEEERGLEEGRGNERMGR